MLVGLYGVYEYRREHGKGKGMGTKGLDIGIKHSFCEVKSGFL